MIRTRIEKDFEDLMWDEERLCEHEAHFIGPDSEREMYYQSIEKVHRKRKLLRIVRRITFQRRAVYEDCIHDQSLPRNLIP